MARLGEKLQNEIEPVIRDFIDCMEPGTPRVEIESYHREDSCQVFIRFKKSLSEKHSLFKIGFKISSESVVRYLRWFLNDIFLQWRFWHLLSYLPVEEISNLAEYFYNADECEKF